MVEPSLVALVPLRDPGRGKTRLAPALDVEARAALSSAMLADVLGALRAARVGRVVVLAGGPGATAAARALGVDALPDPPGGGLTEALRSAEQRIRATTSVVVTADLPTLTPEDVTGLLASDGDVVVAPTRDGGTGGLLRRPAWIVPADYGGRSAARHLLAARRSGRSALMVDLPGFAHDVDLAGDLDDVAAAGRLGPATSHVVRTLGLRSA